MVGFKRCIQNGQRHSDVYPHYNLYSKIRRQCRREHPLRNTHVLADCVRGAWVGVDRSAKISGSVRIDIFV